MIVTNTADPTVIRPSSAPYARFGNIISPPGGESTIWNMLGGDGISEHRMLFNHGHLAGAYSGPLEYVTIRPGGSCGEHLHAEREEIYYIVSGAAWMVINGKKRRVTAGDLITCPMMTRHAIGVDEDASGPMTFFVTEMEPARPPWRPYDVAQHHMPSRMTSSEGYRGNEEDFLRVGQVDLAHHLTGPWSLFSVVEVPVGEKEGPFRPRTGTAEVTLILSGEGEVRLGGETQRKPAAEAAVSIIPFRHVGGQVRPLAAGTAIASVNMATISNTSKSEPLLMLHLGVTC
jgi:mannose-6-phosphate isomerase-like protein (cupin superfamily)